MVISELLIIYINSLNIAKICDKLKYIDKIFINRNKNIVFHKNSAILYYEVVICGI
jgi:hypothetical protein